MANQLYEMLAAAFPAAGAAAALPIDAPAQVLSNVEAHADSRESDAQSRVDRQFIELLARGVIQFAPDPPQETEEPGCAQARRHIPDIDVLRVRARVVASDFGLAGDSVTAAAILDAIKPRRERGRPPEWRPSDVLMLWMDVMDTARRRARHSGRSIFALLKGTPSWNDCGIEELRSKFREGAKKIGMDQAKAIAALRALGD